MKLLEPAPQELVEKVRRRLPPGEEELLRVASDLTADGTFGRRWIIATKGRILVVPADGEVGGIDLPLQDVAAVRVEALVGGGCLEIVRKGAAPVHVLYSASRSAQFAEAARGIEQLRRGEPLLISAESDRTRCERCGRLLPEKKGICPACIRRWAVLRRITAYLKPYRGRAVLLALASLIMTLGTLLAPVITRQIVDDVLLPRTDAVRSLDDRFTLLGLLVLAFLGVRSLSWAAEWLHGWNVTWLGARVTADIRSQLYQQLERLSIRFHDRNSVGSLTARVTTDSGTLEHFLIRGLPHLFINALTLLGILAFMLWMSWPVALAVLLPVPLICAWSVFFWRRMGPPLQRWLQAVGVFFGHLNEVLSGIRVTRVFAQEDREIAAFERHNARLFAMNVDTNRQRTLLLATTGLLTTLGMVVLWLLGGSQVFEGSLTLGTLLAFYSYLWLFYGPLQWLGQVNSWMTQSLAGAERIFEVLDTPTEARDDPHARPLPPVRGQLTFRAVTFGYDPAKPVLRDFSLDIAPGETIGLVGRSGAGKTTAACLLCRLYDPDQGVIELDGLDLRTLRLQELRAQLALVPQEPLLFRGSILENLRYGRPEASVDEVLAAARGAGAHGFIVGKEDGYDAEVGERGGQLSGGERQRLAIARALVRGPKVLILDEATSSVDGMAERRVVEALARLRGRCTTLVIAHRLSTVRHADRIVVLDDGRVAEVGTYEELLARQGIFHELVRMQQEAPPHPTLSPKDGGEGRVRGGLAEV